MPQSQDGADGSGKRHGPTRIPIRLPDTLRSSRDWVLLSRVMRVPLRLRKLLRPLIPDRVMVRWRLHQHSSQSRTNLDVILAGGRLASRLLATTPDTVRVRARFGKAVPALDQEPGMPLPSVDDDSVLLVSMRSLSEGERDGLLAPLSDPQLAASLLGEIVPPRLVARRRTELRPAPVAMAVRGGALHEVGGLPAGERPLPGLLARLQDAGLVCALLPIIRQDASFARLDPIEGPAVLILAAVPLHDVGGGSRGAQLALELLRRGLHVTYATVFSAQESTDLGLRYLHPRLEQVRAVEFEPLTWAARLASGERTLLIELPHPVAVQVAKSFTRLGGKTIYDLVDDWSAPMLGGEWYRPELEDELIAMADGLAGSAPDLLERFASSRRPAALVPNGVNTPLFGRQPGPTPADFPAGEGPVLGYHGSLYGAWMNWHGLAEAARRHPQARVVMIGDDKGHPKLPPNVFFLGLKPQAVLIDYLARFDVGLLPFEVSSVTHAVSPLKVYEYLAAGVPVAAPPLRSLEGLAGISMDVDLGVAVTRALAAPRPDRDEAQRLHGWEGRAELLWRTIGRTLPPRSQPAARVVLRPPIHYARAQRRVGW